MRSFPLMLFAAGFGTRMGALTRDRPKPLIAVAGRSLLDHAVAVADEAGITRRVANLHYRGAQLVQPLRDAGVAVSWETGIILETGGGLRQALPLLGPGPVMTLTTDSVWRGSNPLTVLEQAWDAQRMSALLLLIPLPQAVGHTGTGDFLLAADGRISRARGRPGPVYVGAQIIEPGGLHDIPDAVFSLNVLWDRLIAEGRAYGVMYDGAWCDVGRPEGIALAEECWQTPAMFDTPAPHVFTLPPGVDFAAELVRGLHERLAGQPPEAMARLRLLVNSQRMRRRVTQAMTADGAHFLPRITVITDLHRDLMPDGATAPVSPLRRRLELAKLIGGLLAAQPDLAPRAALYDLADSLAALLAEMQDEGVSAEALSAIDVSTHSAHWARSQAFLSIIAPVMAAQGDDAARQRAAVLRQAALWEATPPTDPIVIAGSTGSRGATAVLMQAVARLDLGAVVLPGFDGCLPEPVWHAMDDVLTAEDHPQFRFRKLMDQLGLSAADLRPWRAAVPANAARNRLISLSLRPAPVTDQWLTEGALLPDLRVATADMTLIEAAGPREEALAIALILRHAVEQGVRSALITADRNLSRRVAAALDLWRIVPTIPLADRWHCRPRAGCCGMWRTGWAA